MLMVVPQTAECPTAMTATKPAGTVIGYLSPQALLIARSTIVCYLLFCLNNEVYCYCGCLFTFFAAAAAAAAATFSVYKSVYGSLVQVPFGALLPAKEARVPAAAKSTSRNAVGGSGAGAKPALFDASRDDDILPIPRSLQEIYAISNKNRKKSKVGAMPAVYAYNCMFSLTFSAYLLMVLRLRVSACALAMTTTEKIVSWRCWCR
jgi:hypothetical protein